MCLLQRLETETYLYLRLIFVIVSMKVSTNSFVTYR